MSAGTEAGADNRRDLTVILTAGAVVLAISFGVRSIFGAVMEPISTELFQGRFEVFSLSIALQNLVWGLSQPFFGMIADRFGDRRALWLGLLCYVAGMLICVYGMTPAAQHLGAGVLVGMGVSGTAFGIVLSVIGRAAPAEKRSQYLGIATAFGSAGQALMPLLAAELIAAFDWRTMLLVLTVLLAPMALCIPFLKAPEPAAPANAAAAEPEESMGAVLRKAFTYPSYGLLTLGFFVCGFHLAFVTAHLPNFVENFCQPSGMSPEELRGLGLQALSLVGLANIVGTLAAGQLGARLPKPYVLSAIYALRALAILVFISLPVTPLSVILFGIAMGFLWLSTVPLTSGLVLGMFGPKYMGTLYGFVFLSHQLGSFLGVWLGGLSFDLYGDYDMVWHLSIALGVMSAIVHLPVRERAYQEARA